MSRLQTYYKETVVPQLKEQLGLENVMEVPRITSSIKIGTRTDKEQSMADKVASVKNKLG